MKQENMFDFDFLEGMVDEIIQSNILYDKEKTSGVWIIGDDPDSVSNIILDFKDNPWKLTGFSFVDMVEVNHGLMIMMIFNESGEFGKVMTYQKTYSCISELLIDNSCFKRLLNHIKINKNKINLEYFDAKE